MKELVKKMHDINPERNLAFTAIEELTDPEEIQQFHEEYREYMTEEGYSDKVADSNIGYILGYYGDDTQILWYGLLGITHPIFGGRNPQSSTGTRINTINTEDGKANKDG